MRTDDIDTPAVVIDLDRVDHNIQRMQAYCDAHGIALRPHIKTHKIPALAHRQVRAGARGITCQKLGEAEVMAAAGLNDILITFNILGAAKLERLARLAREIDIKVTADAPEVVSGLAAMARSEGVVLPVLVECDTGLERAGVQSPDEAVALAQVIAAQSSLRFAGLMTYPLMPAARPFLQRTVELLAAAGLRATVVSGGGTPRAQSTHEFPEVTELRVGNYIYNDRTTVAQGGATIDDCAQHVLATVVSRPTATRGILDAGSKSLTTDLVRDPNDTVQGHGLIIEYPEAVIYGLSEEHGHVDFAACPRPPALGERVRIVANHSCTVSNLFDVVHATRAGQVEAIWPVAARGRVQ